MEEMQAQLKGNEESKMYISRMEHVSVKRLCEVSSHSWDALNEVFSTDDSGFVNGLRGKYMNKRSNLNSKVDSNLNKDHNNDPNENPANYLLSSIEENSEPSTVESNKSDTFNLNALVNVNKQKLSASCQYVSRISDSEFGDHFHHRSQTFPRCKIPLSWIKHGREIDCTRSNTFYPLEPREVDLEIFQQLHTADSQEELQEFLLLESQCMTTEGGLAAAFSDEPSGILNLFTNKYFHGKQIFLVKCWSYKMINFFHK